MQKKCFVVELEGGVERDTRYNLSGRISIELRISLSMDDIVTFAVSIYLSAGYLMQRLMMMH